MKTRTGFVSNSSSSSFVIAFDKKPTEDELVNILFPVDANGNRTGVSDRWRGGEVVDAYSATTLVWQQLADQNPLTKSQIKKEIGSGYFEGYPEHNWNGRDRVIAREYLHLTGKNICSEDVDPSWKKRYDTALKQGWDAQTKAVAKALNELFKREWETKFKGKKCFQVSFSDGDGDVFSSMEHGDTFRNIPHTVISHH